MICCDCPMSKDCPYFGFSPIRPSDKVSFECTLHEQIMDDDKKIVPIIHVPIGFDVEANSGKVTNVRIAVYAVRNKKRWFKL